MKIRFLALLSLLIGISYACSDDNDNGYKIVSEETIAAFKSDFPGATKVEWEKKKEYYVADFKLEGGKRDMEAWYDNSGKRYLTEKDITKGELPAPIITALKSSIYADWYIDEITRVGYETIYIIEVEQGKNEVDLVYNADGVLLKEIVEGGGGHDNGDYLPSALPSEIKSYITTNHASARIVDVDIEKFGWEVEIVEGRIKKDIYFNLEKEWLLTKWDIKKSEIPEIVLTGIKNSIYADWKIDDVEYVINPQGVFYEVEFEKSGQADVEKLFRASDGTMVE